MLEERRVQVKLEFWWVLSSDQKNYRLDIIPSALDKSQQELRERAEGILSARYVLYRPIARGS